MSLLSNKDFDLAIEALQFYIERQSNLTEEKYRESCALRQWLILENSKKCPRERNKEG